MRFLDGVQDAEDVPAYMERVRAEGAEVSRRKIRSLVRADTAPASLSSLPESTVEQLAEAMLMLARVLEAEGEEFAQAFEPARELTAPEEKDDVREMFAELERAEATRQPTL